MELAPIKAWLPVDSYISVAGVKQFYKKSRYFTLVSDCNLMQKDYINGVFILSCILPTFPYVENICEINPSHMVFMIFNCTMINTPWSAKYARKCNLYGFPCEMNFPPLVSESHPRRMWLEWDFGTCGEKNASCMENHTKCMSSLLQGRCRCRRFYMWNLLQNSHKIELSDQKIRKNHWNLLQTS